MKRLPLIIALLVSLLTTAYSQQIRYVKPVASGLADGSSWANASNDLQAMMNALAPAGGQVWVARGTYKPSYKIADTTITGQLTTDRHKSFVLMKNVQVYGGFSGTETSLSQRILPALGSANSSILSGDLGIQNNIYDNSYHVVISVGDKGTACLDGFTITRGNANGDYNTGCQLNGSDIFGYNGGGMWVETTLILKNLTICNNIADYHGGGILMYTYSASYLSVLDNLLIYDNIAVIGGGVSCASSFSMNHVTIRNNTATEWGGGIACHFSSSNPSNPSSSTLTNVTINENIANRGGGGISLINNSSLIIDSSTITNNSVNASDVDYGGGGIHLSNSKIKLINSNLANNSTKDNGGAILASSNSSINLTNIEIKGNTANNGGGVYGGGVMTNCLIINNRANNNGGGLYSMPTLINVTISNNIATNAGGGIYNINATRYSSLRNSIVYNNRANDAPDIWTNNSSGSYPLDIYYSLVGDTSRGSGKGVNVLQGAIVNTDPYFINLYNNYRLLDDSPCINAGNNAYYHPDSIPDISDIITDLDSNKRINCIVDMGAYEYQGSILTRPVIDSSLHICYGDTAVILLDLEESIPCTVIYTRDNYQTLDTLYSDSIAFYPLKIHPLDTTVYKIVQLQMDFCNIDLHDSMIVYVIPVPLLSNSFVSDTLCSGEQTREIIFTDSTNHYCRWAVSGDTIEGLPHGVQTGNFEQYHLENTTESPQTAIIHITAEYMENTLVCTGEADSFSITVLPEPLLQALLEDDTLCDGEQTKSVIFQGQAVTACQWQNTGSIITGIPKGVQTGDFEAYTVENKNTYPQRANIELTPQYKSGTKICLGESDNFSIVVYPQTQIHSFTRNKSMLCEEELLELQVEVTGGDLSYQWYHNGNLLAGEVSKQYIVSSTNLSHSGTYYVEVTGRCGTKTSQNMAIDIGSGKILVEKWDDVILVDNSTHQYYAYQWYKDDKLIPGATNQFYQELSGLNGCYSVELTLANGQKERTCERCVDKTTKAFTLYPNPVQRGEDIQITATEEIISMQLYSIDGKQINRVDYDIKGVKTERLTQGIYIIVVQTKTGRHNGRIVVY